MPVRCPAAPTGASRLCPLCRPLFVVHYRGSMPTWILKKTDWLRQLESDGRDAFRAASLTLVHTWGHPRINQPRFVKAGDRHECSQVSRVWQCVSSGIVAKSGQTWADYYTAGTTVWLVLSVNPSSTQNCHLTNDSLGKRQERPRKCRRLKTYSLRSSARACSKRNHNTSTATCSKEGTVDAELIQRRTAEYTSRETGTKRCTVVCFQTL